MVAQMTAKPPIAAPTITPKPLLDESEADTVSGTAGTGNDVGTFVGDSVLATGPIDASGPGGASTFVAFAVGLVVGIGVGRNVGRSVGCGVGLVVGICVGRNVGRSVGCGVGIVVGAGTVGGVGPLSPATHPDVKVSVAWLHSPVVPKKVGEHRGETTYKSLQKLKQSQVPLSMLQFRRRIHISSTETQPQELTLAEQMLHSWGRSSNQNIDPF